LSDVSSNSAFAARCRVSPIIATWDFVPEDIQKEIIKFIDESTDTNGIPNPNAAALMRYVFNKIQMQKLRLS
jgi:hypothetical protein